MKPAMLQSNRQRVQDIKKQNEQNKPDSQEYIHAVREDEARERYQANNQLEEKDAYRQSQQEIAVSSMRTFIDRQKRSKENFLAKNRDGLRTILHAQDVFENSLRKLKQLWTGLVIGNCFSKTTKPRASCARQCNRKSFV